MEFGNSAFYTRSGLLAIGVSDAEIKRARRSGSIVDLGPGAYVDAAVFRQLSDEDRHAMAVRAVAASCIHPIVSHQSAAVLHGFEQWAPDLSRVHLSTDRANGGRRNARIHLHTNRLPAGSVGTVNGLSATTGIRTAVDLARSLSFEAAVCVLDSALRVTGASRDDLLDVLSGCAGMTGCSSARRAIAFADGRSESVGESRSRVYAHRHGFPPLELQVTLRHGSFVARPDLLLGGVLIEFDGKLKYTSREVLLAEKKRQDELTSLGWIVVRWTWDDLATDAAAIKLRRALDQARRLPPPLTVREPPAG